MANWVTRTLPVSTIKEQAPRNVNIALSVLYKAPEKENVNIMMVANPSVVTLASDEFARRALATTPARLAVLNKARASMGMQPWYPTAAIAFPPQPLPSSKPPVLKLHSLSPGCTYGSCFF